MKLFDCPDCNQTHGEPVDATLGFRVRCLDCELHTAIDAAVATGTLSAAA